MDKFWNNLGDDEKESVLVFARFYMGEFFFEDGELERVPVSLRDYYSELRTKIDIFLTRVLLRTKDVPPCTN